MVPLAVCAVLVACAPSMKKPSIAGRLETLPAGTGAKSMQPAVPGWVFPLSAPAVPAPAARELVRLLNSSAVFTRAQLTDRFAAPDWYPSSHAPMPGVVARGRAPDLFACGYCHTPAGQGRPENAPLAGLSSEYIIQQIADFKSGARRALLPGVFPPADTMIHEAAVATPAEVQIAADYFSHERLRPRVIVLERSRVPRTRVVGSVYTPIANRGDEPLGTRLIELARDSEQHENRDEQMRYIAYVPPGSIARGRKLARTGDNGVTVACITCHGDKLQGMGTAAGVGASASPSAGSSPSVGASPGAIAAPPLAGRSPSYLLRQLLAFQTGARSGPGAQPMQPVVAHLDIGNMIDVAAFAASLRP
jgi:cytochrome c553